MTSQSPPIDELKARAGSRRLSRKVIIASEGKRTERDYIGMIASQERIPSPIVNFAQCDGTDPLTVVTSAIETRRTLIADREYDPNMGDQTWVLFDVDEHRANDAKGFNRAIELARTDQVLLATSNPSFEIWLLLHFRDQNANISRQNVCSELKKHLSEYDKRLTLAYRNLLKPNVTEAIRRAKELDKRYSDGSHDQYPNPQTSVYKLVELLIEIGAKY